MKPLIPEYQTHSESFKTRTHPALLEERKMAHTVVLMARSLKSVRKLIFDFAGN